jgi:hypothetical protein
MSASRHGYSLQYALESQSAIQNGYVLFAEFLESPQPAGAVTSEPMQDNDSDVVIVGLSDAISASFVEPDFAWVAPLAVSAPAKLQPHSTQVRRDNWFHLYGSASLRYQSELPNVEATFDEMEVDPTSSIRLRRVTNSDLDRAIERADFRFQPVVSGDLSGQSDF